MKFIITVFALIVYFFAFILGKNPDKNGIKSLFWKKNDSQRVAKFCAKIERECFEDDSFRVRHPKRVEFAKYLSKIIDLNQSLNML